MIDPAAAAFIPACRPFVPEIPAFIPKRRPASEKPHNMKRQHRMVISVSKQTAMKSKQLLLVIGLFLVAGGLWYGRTALQTRDSEDSGPGAGATNHDVSGRDVRAGNTNGQPTPDNGLRPPDELRKFRDLSPEQRVRRAKNPNGVGG